MRILYGVGSWGLGHATRSLAVLERLLAAGAEVTVVSAGRALALLRRELGDRCALLAWPDVPQTLGRTAWGFYLRSALAVPAMLRVMAAERAATAALHRHRRFDRIVSDNRYGIQHRDVPSFHVAHSLRFLAPGRVRLIELLLEAFNCRWFGRLRKVIVPDSPQDRLAGDLAHDLRVFPPSLLAYVGPLCSVRPLPLPEDVDVFVTLSGPEPQRTLLERRILRQVRGLEGRVVVALGRPEDAGGGLGGAEVYPYLDRRRQQEMLARARVVVSRSGYTTVCELATLGKRAVLVPTPGQTEQAYLARYHDLRGAVRAASQDALDLARDTAAAAARPGLRATVTADEAAQRAAALILDG
ncbi:MAG: glycosyltransferase family protein [Armatimonadota bacterium]|nr:glycosyltransferase family protein [Armatimonadota bacterium]MDR7401021.1 glycosyltransferase family protein [Armatimonadota bacterium]MDR7403229.1 glycosyltransferase family protein [Armatimonadota bacterium]MDR7436732.1 glycosyltransferase family protein [Armatimonadota bacterium]MDR7471196.1 glycosyltransferase family protein [Armatimonadota bacterium]